MIAHLTGRRLDSRTLTRLGVTRGHIPSSASAPPAPGRGIWKGVRAVPMPDWTADANRGSPPSPARSSGRYRADEAAVEDHVLAGDYAASSEGRKATRRPHAEIIGEVVRSRRPEVTFARWLSISSSVASPAATSSSLTCRTVAASSTAQAAEVTGK